MAKTVVQVNLGKVITDLTVSLTLGGDCLTDIATLREHNVVFGRVRPDPTVSRLITASAADAPAVVTAIDTARASAPRVPGRWPSTPPCRSATGLGSSTPPASSTSRRGGRDASDLQEETPASRRAVEVHRFRRPSVDYVRHQYRPRPSAGFRTSAPSPRPLRGPHPHRQVHRSDQFPPARVRPESHLAGDRSTHSRLDGADSNARLHQPRITRWEPKVVA